MRRVLTFALATAVTATVAAAVPAQAASLTWQACGNSGAECASLKVPLDWAHPSGPQITLAASRVRAADPQHRIGTLFVNFGGPGGPAMPIVRDGAAMVFPQQLRDRFDIVGIDPRGVGDSTPTIACELPTSDPRVSRFPSSRAEYDRLVAYNREVGEGCRRATGPLIDHVDTISAARDFEAARIALGESKVSWLGLSYGTLLGATYAQFYPNRVRSAVLDGAVDHTIGSWRLASDEAKSAEGVFAKFADWCRTTDSCAMHGRDLTGEYRALLNRASHKPVPAQGFPAGANAEQIGFVTYSTLATPPARWAELAQGISDAVAATPNAAFFAGPSASEAAYRVIGCHDFPSDVRGYADLAARIREVNRIAPNIGGYTEGWDVQAGCLGWPVPPANPWASTPVRGASNVLVVTGSNDPSTPRPWALGLVSQIQGAKLLEWNGVGHTGYFNDGPTKQREVDHLLTSLGR
ncbi:alpha/beta fold hydrolase [Kutzneria albida]|uniref:Uncharacterized protein n=1 Tax=Kutzneria albida DSM 43870 TaxID=1449976 RepID=W5W8Z1_9PSEU|nr:alpha/beta fold hydrolase [Kutzneria albida]AHH97195.1 hypothetical protein KALB_3831 [Kutzneria albida DSM 43870]